MDGEVKREAWVEQWGSQIEALGISALALSLLETANALGFLGSQVLLLAQPLLGGFVDEAKLKRATMLLESPELLERVRQQLEEG